ncbi:etoposide-induced protein 2.4-domain-containing protein [Catenaria anguillulae PL171]|uniref:Etoposide-induced protein 2.4-domain-containing protein n=1 Tax=Catenaria anguillulae PL171 TaxID=765915 RepID=A0A1Y2I603_9FUNG|nr:etoposide-induced protein 2.4-domain-containing protein [Catenaria anguillulae PL171]
MATTATTPDPDPTLSTSRGRSADASASSGSRKARATASTPRNRSASTSSSDSSSDDESTPPTPMPSFNEAITNIRTLMLRGLMDATINVPTALVIASSSKKIQAAAVKCFVLNGLLLLGSIAFYRLVINGIVGSIFAWTTSREDDKAFETVDRVLWALFHVFWVYPVYALSFVLNSMWYQDIADRALDIRSAQLRTLGQPGLDAPPMSVRNKLKRTIVDELYRGLLCVVHLSLAMAAYVAPALGPVTSFIMTCWQNAMYCFEYKWVQKGWSLEHRLRHIEDQWPYYLGFGLPTTALTFYASSVVSSGVFAVLFPLYIITATLTTPPTDHKHGVMRSPTSPTESTRSLEPKSRGLSTSTSKNVDPLAAAIVPRLPVFALTNQVCQTVLRQMPMFKKVSRTMKESGSTGPVAAAAAVAAEKAE